MIWLVGARGMLGSRLARVLEDAGENFVASDLEVDITSEAAIAAFARKHADIDCLINCSAYTNVDGAESDRETAFRINETGVANLAECAASRGALFVHVSTDYVFDGKGTRPYREDDPVGPVSVYGASKLAGERAALAVNPRTVIVRTAWLYDAHGKNFLLTMLRLMRERSEIRVVADQQGSPTWAAGLAEALAVIAASRADRADADRLGIFHYSDAGMTTWHGFAEEIARLGFACGLLPKLPRVIAIPTSEYPTPATRPAWSLLDKTKIVAAWNVGVCDWKENLSACLGEVE